MSITNSAILQALSTVNDPDLKKDLVTLNMIKDIVVSDEKVSFTVVLTTPACPLKEKIKNDCLEAVKKVVGDKVSIDILMTSSVTTSRDNAPLLPGVKNIIAIAYCFRRLLKRGAESRSGWYSCACNRRTYRICTTIVRITNACYIGAILLMNIMIFLCLSYFLLCK